MTIYKLWYWNVGWDRGNKEMFFLSEEKAQQKCDEFNKNLKYGNWFVDEIGVEE